MSGAAEDGNYMGVFRRGARGTIDIIADILALCSTWNKRTKIMYKANLSHQMLKFYLWHLVELGLLEESQDMKFKTTEKGRTFLSHYRQMTKLLIGLSGHVVVPRDE
ncbi:MAG: winged helix-turn-helix domain-containing protein [Thermoproteota archaeon]